VAAAAARDFERLGNESSDLQLVKRTAWELLYAAESAQAFALWAVGVMYSATGERRVVALTQHAAGYVPPGISVPTTVAMAWSDPVIDEDFRSRWTGNLDPAATLIAYAALKAAEPQAWRLAAVASTWSEVEALMMAAQRWGTEWALCSRITMPADIAPKSVDPAGAHRLGREFPELAAQVAELKLRGLDHRVGRLLTDALVAEARLVVLDSALWPGEGGFPENFEAVWPVAATGTVPAAERVRFAEAVQQQWSGVWVAQPGWDADAQRSATAYRSRWLIGRALEAVLGWVADSGTDRKPAALPVADMVYAAAHAHLDGRGTGWITDLFVAAERVR
jgi:hypothetical protein